MAHISGLVAAQYQIVDFQASVILEVIRGIDEKMDVEKRASKGGFLQLFDWNVKSRKKLFSNKSELLEEGSKQGKENVVNSMILCPQLMEGHERGPGPRGKGSSDFNFASTVSGDEGYGTRAPGVVARLMGLDSLPNSNSSESCSTPFCDSPFVRGSHSQRSIFSFRSRALVYLRGL